MLYWCWKDLVILAPMLGMEQTVQLMTASAETCQLIQGWDKQARARMKEERQRADHPQATVSAVLLTVWGLVLHALVFGKCDPRIHGLTFQPENLGWYQKKRSFVKHYNRFLGGERGIYSKLKNWMGKHLPEKFYVVESPGSRDTWGPSTTLQALLLSSFLFPLPLLFMQNDKTQSWERKQHLSTWYDLSSFEGKTESSAGLASSGELYQFRLESISLL